MKYKKETISIQKLPSGDDLSIKVYKFYGKGKKKVYVQANIHGPELTGILVAKKLISYIKKNRGDFAEFIIVPSCNPMGLNSQFLSQQTGYVNQLTGKNWNRIYPDLSTGINFPEKGKISIGTYKKLLIKNLNKKLAICEDLETKLGLALLKLSFDADIVIDLHTAWGKAPHYIYAYPDQFEQVKHFKIGNVFLLDTHEFLGVFDEANLYPYFKLKDKISNFELPKQVFTLELGNDCSLEPENIDLGFEELKSYLNAQDVLPGSSTLNAPTNFDICLQKDYVYYFAPTGGLLIWTKAPGEYFKKGEILGSIYEIESEKATFVKGKHDGKMMIQFNAHAIHQGQQICKIMSDVRKEISS